MQQREMDSQQVSGSDEDAAEHATGICVEMTGMPFKGLVGKKPLRGGDTEAGSWVRRSQLHEDLGEIIPGARNKGPGVGLNLEHSRDIKK